MQFPRAILKDRLMQAGIGLVLAILLLTGWLLFAGAAFGDRKDAAYTHMHCPLCREEVPYVAKLAGTECPICHNGATYVPTVGSIWDGNEPFGLGANIVLFALITVVLAQGLIYLAVLRSRALLQAEEEIHNKVLVCHCPYCQRKIGYRAARSGTAGVCPRCKTAFLFTDPAADEDQEP